MLSLLQFAIGVVTVIAGILQLASALLSPTAPFLNYVFLLFNFGPKWGWLLLSVLWVIVSFFTGSKLRWLALILLPVMIWSQDIQFSTGLSSSVDNDAITVLSINSGGKSQSDLQDVIRKSNADIVLLQEANLSRKDGLFSNEWITSCDAHLCIASKFPYEKEQSFGRAVLNDWGSYAASYQVYKNGIRFRVVNAHLETPRDAISGKPFIDFDRAAVEAFVFKRSVEFMTLQGLLEKQDMPTVVAGDFNTTVLEHVYRKHLGNYQNAITESGAGVNYTKFTNWHGVRIDHIVVSQEIAITASSTLSKHSGDHVPLVAHITL